MAKTYVYKSKVGDHSWGRPDGSLFNSYFTDVQARALILSLDCSILPLICNIFKQGGIKYYFLSLWYDSTWYWTLNSLAISKHSTFWKRKKERKWKKERESEREWGSG